MCFCCFLFYFSSSGGIISKRRSFTPLERATTTASRRVLSYKKNRRCGSHLILFLSFYLKIWGRIVSEKAERARTSCSLFFFVFFFFLFFLYIISLSLSYSSSSSTESIYYFGEARRWSTDETKECAWVEGVTRTPRQGQHGHDSPTQTLFSSLLSHPLENFLPLSTRKIWRLIRSWFIRRRVFFFFFYHFRSVRWIRMIEMEREEKENIKIIQFHTSSLVVVVASRYCGNKSASRERVRGACSSHDTE